MRAARRVSPSSPPIVCPRKSAPPPMSTRPRTPSRSRTWRPARAGGTAGLGRARWLATARTKPGPGWWPPVRVRARCASSAAQRACSTSCPLDDDLSGRETVRLGDETGMAGVFDDVRPFTIGNELHAAVLIFAPDSNEWTRAGLVRIVDGAYRDSGLLPTGAWVLPERAGPARNRRCSSLPGLVGNRPRCSA